MNVGIITLHRVLNYGSVLQTYALQEHLRKMDHSVEVIDYMPERFSRKNFYTTIKKDKWRKTFLHKAFYCLAVFPRRMRFKHSFQPFIKKNINLSSKRYDDFEGMLRNCPVYDIYFTGSDQVWNSTYNGKVDKVFFLDFVPKNKKRIAYAGSFGRTELDDNEIETTKKLIEKYDAISVRESSALKILNKMGRHDGVNVVDPTLLLDRDDWSKVSSKLKLKKKYLLLYLLNENQAMTDSAREIANKLGLKVVQIGFNRRQRDGVDTLMTNITPDVFLSLLMNAGFVLTDSFHGTAFSINFNKQLAVVLPERFSTRLTSILSVMGIEDRIIHDGKNISSCLEPIDFRMVNERLIEERRRANEFLTETLQ